ncbi:MAG TPA: ABC transporter substrate-binding protein [Burkholderiaceae bacterium]|nr:ABC transporter substrate-binding protein [Burkholderiaceae bacterium]
MSSSKRWTTIVKSIAWTIVATTACAAQAADIVIGQVTPLSGILATSGEQIRQGVQIYFDHVNESGGIHGARIRHIVRDDAYKPEETLKHTRELISRENAVALVGFAGTANIGELLKQGVLAKANMPLVAPITGADVLRTPFTPNVFHIRASYADEMEYMVETLLTIGINRIGVFYQNDPFGKAGVSGVEQALTKRNLKIAASASYERGTEEVAEAVKAMRTSEPNAIIMISVNRPAAAFAREYRKAGGKAQLLNLSVVDPGELVKLAGPEAIRGLGITQVVPFPYAITLPVIREYHVLLKKHGAPGAEISYLGFESFLGAKILVEALRRAGPNPTPERVLRALENMDRLDVGGFVVGYSPRSRIGSKFVDMAIVGRDGRLHH